MQHSTRLVQVLAKTAVSHLEAPSPRTPVEMKVLQGRNPRSEKFSALWPKDWPWHLLWLVISSCLMLFRTLSSVCFYFVQPRSFCVSFFRLVMPELWSVLSSLVIPDYVSMFSLVVSEFWSVVCYLVILPVHLPLSMHLVGFSSQYHFDESTYTS